MKTLSLRSAALSILCVSFLAAQPPDNTKLRQVFIVSRHSVRASVAPNSYLNSYSARPFPAFNVAPGILTENGAKLETILGGYYRLWLTKEGLLTGKDASDAPYTYFRANVIQRTRATAQAFAAGLLPGASINVISFPDNTSDPLFDPVGAGVARLDPRKAVAAVKGRLGGSAASLASAFAPELALTRSILLGYPPGQTPVPATPPGVIDATTIPIEVTPGSASSPVHLGGLDTVSIAVDPFIMQYADGMPSADVGWGQLTAPGLIQTMRLYNLEIDLNFRTPYLAGVQSSNLASHVVRSLLQSATGNAMPGALGDPAAKVIMLVASDVNLGSLAGLFYLDWLLPGYQENYCAPGGALVLELRQSQRNGEYIVRASYIAQTLEQLRNRTALTLSAPPAIAPVFIPGCSTRNATFDCALTDFVEVSKHVIDPASADRVQ